MDVKFDCESCLAFRISASYNILSRFSIRGTAKQLARFVSLALQTASPTWLSAIMVLFCAAIPTAAGLQTS